MSLQDIGLRLFFKTAIAASSWLTFFLAFGFAVAVFSAVVLAVAFFVVAFLFAAEFVVLVFRVAMFLFPFRWGLFVVPLTNAVNGITQLPRVQNDIQPLNPDRAKSVGSSPKGGDS